MKNLILCMVMLVISFTFTACAQRVVYSSNVAVVRTVPRGATVVVHGGVSYRYVNGLYYRPYTSGFRIVTPPIGLRVSVLPSGFSTLTLAGRPYFVAGGVYYMQSGPNVYIVVQKPVESLVAENPPAEAANAIQHSMVASLPQGTSMVTINNKHYYKVNDTYYEKVTSENGEAGFVIVGKMQ